MPILDEHNAEQRQKVANLGLQALEVLDTVTDDAAILDAVLCVEVVEGDGGNVVHYFATTDRVSVKRGIIEHVRDDLGRMDGE